MFLPPQKLLAIKFHLHNRLLPKTLHRMSQNQVQKCQEGQSRLLPRSVQDNVGEGWLEVRKMNRVSNDSGGGCCGDIGKKKLRT